MTYLPEANRDHDALVKALDPRKHGYSPKMSAIIGALLGFDYGVRDSHGGTLTTPFSVTSDGFVLCGHTTHDTGAFIGTVTEFNSNIQRLVHDANLTPAQATAFQKILTAHVHAPRILKRRSHVEFTRPETLE